MNIIPNNYEKILKEMIFNQFSSNLKKELYKTNNTNKSVFEVLKEIIQVIH